MCQYRFINCNNYTTLVGDVDNGGGYACVGREYRHISVPFNFSVNLKLKKSLKNNNNNNKNLFVLKLRKKMAEYASNVSLGYLNRN